MYTAQVISSLVIKGERMLWKTQHMVLYNLKKQLEFKIQKFKSLPFDLLSTDMVMGQNDPWKSLCIKIIRSWPLQRALKSFIDYYPSVWWQSARYQFKCIKKLVWNRNVFDMPINLVESRGTTSFGDKENCIIESVSSVF